MPEEVPSGLIPTDPDAKTDAPPKTSSRPTTRAGRRAAAEAKKASGKADNKPKPSTPSPRKASLENRLADQLMTIGVVVSAVGITAGPRVQVDGVIVVEHAPSIAKALADVASGNPAVARALERMLAAGTYAALSSALLPMVLAILANHEVIPEGMAAQLGVKVPTLGADPAPEPEAPTQPIPTQRTAATSTSPFGTPNPAPRPANGVVY